MYNFSEHRIQFPAYALRDVVGEFALDHLSGSGFSLYRPTITLEPFRALWLTPTQIDL